MSTMTTGSLPPLAERMRPTSLDNYVGQSTLIGPDGYLRKIMQGGLLPSLILWGPPGVGKTTLAHILANSVKAQVFVLSAINSGVKDIREVLDKAKSKTLFTGAKPVLFIDEIHRFSKSQQDSLLGAVEKGTITLIGATTENPSFEVIPALLSRAQVYTLTPLSVDELKGIVNQALRDDTELQKLDVQIEEWESLLAYSSGDARKLLNVLEMVISGQDPSGPIVVKNETVTSSLQNRPITYDKDGEMHYDIISAFIKSIRGSDPNAALYYMARMIEGGEDPTFIARRLLILASEDIGNANPTALILANNAFDAVKKIGMPESRIILSQCAIYLASSPKSNSSYIAIDAALAEVKASGDLPIPMHLRNAPTQLMKDLNYGSGYKYAHDHPGNFVNQEFMPDALRGKSFIKMGENDREKGLKARLLHWWKNKYSW